MQEVGLSKGYFSESCLAKMLKESEPPLGGFFGKEHVGELAHIKVPVEEKTEPMEAQNTMDENDNEALEDDEFGLNDIVDQF